MKELRYVYVCETEYNNLAQECLVMVKNFLPQYKWQLSKDVDGENEVIIKFIDGRFFMEIKSSAFTHESRMLTYKDRLHEWLDDQPNLGKISLDAHLSIGDKESLKGLYKKITDTRHDMKVALYEGLSLYTTRSLPWGVLQGIRPTKLVYKIAHKLDKSLDESAARASKHAVSLQGLSEDSGERVYPVNQWAPLIRDILEVQYLLSTDMAKLAVEVAATEERYLPENPAQAKKAFSVYLSIPFCPTRCHYCSFPAYEIGKWEKRMDEYVDGLITEMKAVLPKIMKHKRISTLYIGGGTPTTLSVDLLDKLLAYLRQVFPKTLLKEFTLEAGRADTITKEKLLILKKYEVDRISINPQSMNQCTLDKIGRKVEVEQVIEAYNMALDLGFKRVNMDLILGLPDESLDDVRETFEQVMSLDPEEVTVHTLAIKRSSKIHENMDNYHLPSDGETKEMLALSRKILLEKATYKPYYLYRQKNMVASYENVGYTKTKPCIYNMEIMEEVISIYAFGAGAITKVVAKDGKVNRVENVKNADIYLERLDDMIKRKLEAIDKFS